MLNEVTPALDDLEKIVRSRTYDPLPDDVAPDTDGCTWITIPGQAELAKLHRLVHQARDAVTNVEYMENSEEVLTHALFRTAPSSTSHAMLATSGPAELFVDGVFASSTDGTGDLHFDPETPEAQIVIDISTQPGTEPALAVLAGDLDESEWRWSTDGFEWHPTSRRVGSRNAPPSKIDEPRVNLVPIYDDGVFSLTAPVLGRIVLKGQGHPVLVSGESRAETFATHDQQESNHELRLLDDGRWVTVNDLGFQYFRVEKFDVQEATVEAFARPILRRGGFACSDEQLTDIWVTSAYTLRSCMHGFLLDGIKRDRMPWMGDQALATLAMPYAFADQAILEDGLSVLGRNRVGYINGISDYSMWWSISTALLTRYFDADEYLSENADRIHAFMNRLAADATSDGVFRVTIDASTFNRPVLIDWGVELEDGRDSTALQMLWYWALRSASDVLERVKHPGANTWRDLASRLRDTLFSHAWSVEKGIWEEYLDHSGSDSPYPNFLAVLSGIHESDIPAGVAATLERSAGSVGTPFMQTFALSALGLADKAEAAVTILRDRWGAMLGAGARTFWEGFDNPTAGHYGFYGRPFGKSLCHAWSAGPAALLPELVCGIRPTADAWRTFEVSPHLGNLSWAGAIVPVPTGEIRVLVTPESVEVDVPPATTLVMANETFQGPQRLHLPRSN